MADKSKTIIVRKIKKGHGDAHGGSWKVAYADFVTAMMAFFLLLWLISMVTPEKRASLADYFRNFNVFQTSGRSFMEQSSGIQKEVKTSTAEMVTGEMKAEDLKEKLRSAIEDKLKTLKDQIMLDVVDGGVRIQVVDLEGRPMFLSGSAEPNEKCKEILKVVSENIKDTTAKIAVEGHTDSAPFKGNQITNWELSTGRASSARKELEKNGISSERIARVVGYADTEPLDKENPMDAKNRRISIILLSGHAPSSQQPSTTAEASNSEAAKPESEQAIPILPPSAQSVSAHSAAVKKHKAPEREAPSKGKTKIADTGVKPYKPIDIRPSVFPGLGQ